MREKNRLRPRLGLLGLCFAVVLSGCSMAITPPPGQGGTADGMDFLIGGAVDPEKGYHRVVESSFTPEETARAEQTLQERGVLAGMENMAWEDAVSRAMFIRLIVTAMGASPEPQDLSGETWYAPYVRGGYAAGLFTESGKMSFLPTDGFLMGSRGFAPMEENIDRYDAAAILAPLIPREEQGEGVTFADESEIPAELLPIVKRAAAWGLLPALGNGGFYGEGPLSWGQSLVCACRILDRTVEPSEPLPAPGLAALLSKGGRVVHAGGRVGKRDGKSVASSNSAEAVIHAYGAGERVLEIDFNFTSDGGLACIHDWSSRFSGQITEGVPLSMEEWKTVRLFDELTPLCLDSLAGFMRQHPDLYVVTDVKENNPLAADVIARTCPDLLDRFVIQIYEDGEYEPIAALGFSHIIYTLYNLSSAKKADTQHWMEYASEHALAGYTFPVEWMEREGYVQEMRKAGIPLFVHTVNGQAAIQDCYDRGIGAVYTDEVMGEE